MSKPEKTEKIQNNSDNKNPKRAECRFCCCIKEFHILRFYMSLCNSLNSRELFFNHRTESTSFIFSDRHNQEEKEGKKLSKITEI